MGYKLNPLTGLLDLTVTALANASTTGLLTASDWTTFNNKLDSSRFNYILNPDAEIDTANWNLYNDTGRTASAYIVNQDLTFTSALSGGSGNGVNIEYIYNAGFPSSAPNINVISSTYVQVRWANGPTVANNPTATQLKAAWDAVPAALAIATVAITGTASRLQYIIGSTFLANGGDTAPTDGTGGVPTDLTFTRSTSAPLVGVASFLLSKGASSQLGSGVSTDFTINAADKGNSLQLSFYYSADAGLTLGTSSDVRAFLYDVTNAVFIPLAVNYLKGPTSNTIYRFSAAFLASATSVSYRLVLHTATSNATAWNLKLDSVTVSPVLDAVSATQVPSLVLLSQPITGAVTDHMAVQWTDGATAWAPAVNTGNDQATMFGFATNISGLFASITIRGLLGGFSVGPFVGYNQYVDNTAGGISPLPSPFRDNYVTMGKGISATEINVQPFQFFSIVGHTKGSLLTSSGANDGTGDLALAGGTTGQYLMANTSQTLGLQWTTPVATAPLTYTASTHTWAMPAASDGVNGYLTGADHTTYTGYAATLALKAPLASPVFTGTPSLPTGTTGVTQAAADSTTKLATTAFVTTADNLKANLASPTFSGTPSLPTGTTGVTQAAGNSTTALATTAFVTTADNLKANIASPTLTGDVTLSTGNLLISTIGKGPQVKTGTNAKIGTAVLVAGTVTVANTSVTTNSRIFVTSQVDGGTIGSVRISAKVVGTSFTISSSNILDTSTAAWYIVESIP